MKLYMKRLTAIPFDTAGWQTLPWQLAGRECCLQQNHDFRFIDHGDSKIGLSSPTKRIMWSPPFFEQDKQDLKKGSLEVEFKQLWPGFERCSGSGPATATIR